MKKQDLKTGMIVKTRSGETALVMIDNCYGEDAIVFSGKSWTPLEGFSEDLIWHKDDEDRSYCRTVDIVKIYKPALPTGFLSRTDKHRTMSPIWERKEEKVIPEFTMEQLVDRAGFEFKIKK